MHLATTLLQSKHGQEHSSVYQLKHASCHNQWIFGHLYEGKSSTMERILFNNKAITNIFSYSEMADKYRSITYDSEKEDSFIVHFPEKPIPFERVGMNLNVFKLPISMNAKNALIKTINEHKTFYTKRQIR